MIRIALVGEIGSGKTFISKLFNYPLFNADHEVNKIYKTNRSCFKKLNKKFPKNITTFPIRKEEIRNILSKKNIKILSKIVHPFVRLNLKKFLKKYSRSEYVVLDIPLLIENKIYKKSDVLVFVKTQKKIILKRLLKRGNYNHKILNILRSQQTTIRRKIKLSKFFINNSNNKKTILKKVKEIKKELK